MRVEAVGPGALGDFIELPFLLPPEPRWIPPLRSSVQAELDGTSAFFRYGRAQAFLASAGGRAVGRVAALVNGRLGDPGGAPIGQVGYFECIDDADTARALFASAFHWLRAAGARSVLGPMNGGVHRQHRLMVAGFERSPFLLEPRNPPHYPRLFLEAGFAAVARWVSVDTDRPQHEALRPRFARLARARAALDLPDLTDVPAVLARLHPLLDRVWGDHLGYAHIEPEELADTLAPILPFMARGQLWFFRQDGEDLGYGLAYPDLADQVRALAGDASGWGRWGDARPDRIVLHTFALAPALRTTRAVYQMFGQGVEASLTPGFERHVEALLVSSMPLLFPATREYALYGRAL